MTDNQAKGQLGIWSLTPGQVVEANRSPLPPVEGYWVLDADGREVELASEDGVEVYDGKRVSLSETDAGYRLTVGGDEMELDGDELREELLDLLSYVPSMDDIVDSMEEFEAAKEAGRGAIAMTRAVTVRIDGIESTMSSMLGTYDNRSSNSSRSSSASSSSSSPLAVST